jgi:hypothetical protein
VHRKIYHYAKSRSFFIIRSLGICQDVEGAVPYKQAPTVSHKSRIVPRFVSTFKRYCRAEIGENIFQRSYHDHVVRNQDEYNRIWSYIERNPEFWKKDCFYSVSAE